MSAPRQVEVSLAQRQELVWLRDHHVKPYLRERASALLKIADGMPLSVVAAHGLLKPHHPATVRAGWRATNGKA